jgi:hypothetical protein
MAMRMHCIEHDTLHPKKFALTSSTSGGGSVGTVCLRTNATEFGFLLVLIISHVHSDMICLLLLASAL